MNRFMHLILTLLMLFALGQSAAAETDFYTEMPPLLRFTQETIREELKNEAYVQVTYPDTANDAVDAHMRALIDEMKARNLPQLPLNKADIPGGLDVGAIISRTGTSVLSFLTLCEISQDAEQLSVEFTTRVWDMESGKQLALTDFFAEDSGAWDVLRSAVRDQLTEAFPGMDPVPGALEQLLQRKSLESADFTLGGARLTLTYRADALYPGKNTLLHVHVYYPEIREMMTDFGKAQTDNSRFRMIALTFDDGGARGSTRNVLNALRRHGAQATFFVVGSKIARNHDTLARQQDSGHSIQSHSYTHRYPKELKSSDAYKEKERMERELGEVIGVVPTMMRTPGGDDRYYVRWKIGYPLINWSAASGDSGNDNVKGIITRLKNRARDGAIALMHDINSQCHKYTEAFLEHLCERGYLCVTVEELFSDAGVTLEPNRIYYSPYRIDEYAPNN